MNNSQFKIKSIVSACVASALTMGSVALNADPLADPAQTTNPATIASVTDRIIVKYRDGSSGFITQSEDVDRTQILSLETNTRMQYVRSTGNDARVLKLDKAKSVEEVHAIAEQIAANPEVLYAEPDIIMQPLAVPLDPEYSRQWHYFEPAGGVNLPDAWDVATGTDVVVAVIDTGITGHEDLVDNTLPGYDFISDVDMANDGDGRDDDATDPGNWTQAGSCATGLPIFDRPSNWHGTHVAGTIAAASNNGQGVAGVAWDAKILPVRVLGRCGGYSSDIADAMRWAAGLDVQGVSTNPNPARVLNLSLGGAGACGETYQTAIDEVREAGASVVVSAGNEAQDASLTKPANCDGVIAVAATDRDGGSARYSNFGGTVDVSAPGGELSGPLFGIPTPENGVLSTLNTGTAMPELDTYDYYQGTSMAAPHVAGVAALLYSIDPDLSPDEVEALIIGTARAFPDAEAQCNTQDCGAGILDASAAVNAVANGEIPSFFINAEDIDIPDNDSQGVVSAIDVARSGDAGLIRVSVDIEHTYRGDLLVQLIAPNGERVTLKQARLGDSQANFQERFRIDATGTDAAGRWSLFVADKFVADTGRIDSWSITFE